MTFNDELVVAYSFVSIGSSYSMAGRYNEAEKMCIRAVNIYVELAESQPAVYEKFYVLSLWNLYLIYDDSNNSQSASILLESAKELFLKYGYL